jgi:hypothetical protein
MGSFDSFNNKSNEIIPTREFPSISNNAKSINNYNIINNAENIEAQYHHLISKCSEYLIPSTIDTLARSLVSKVRECCNRWKSLNPESYNQHFNNLLPSEIGAGMNPCIQNNEDRCLYASLNLAQLLLSHIKANSTERVINLLNDIVEINTIFGNLSKWEQTNQSMLSLFQKLFSKLKNEGAEQEWLHSLPIYSLAPMNNCDDRLPTKLLGLIQPPKGEDKRTEYNLQLANYYRSGYGQWDRCARPFKIIRTYLQSEKSRLLLENNGKNSACQACGAFVGSKDTFCIFCGTEFLTAPNGTKTLLKLDTLLPVLYQGDTIDIPSALDTIDNLRSCLIDGAFNNDLEVFHKLISWYNQQKEVLKGWDEGKAILTEFRSTITGQFILLANKARGNTVREQQVTKLLITWKKDCLKESCGAGLFANSKKKEAKWKERARDQLGFL